MSDAAAPDDLDLDELPPYLRAPPKAAIHQLPGTERLPEPEPAAAPPAARQKIDLERLEADYRAGTMTVRECGAKHGISHTRVGQYAKKHGWVRDLRAQARIKAAGLLANAQDSAQPPLVVVSELDAVAAGMAYVRTKHRKLIEEQRLILADLLAEVRALNSVGDIMEAFRRAELARNPDAKIKAYAEAVRRIQGLPSRVYAINKLALATSKVIYLERQAFDLDAPDDGAPPPPREKDVTAAEAFAWLSQQRPK